jgi:hypothetical protein
LLRAIDSPANASLRFFSVFVPASFPAMSDSFRTSGASPLSALSPGQRGRLARKRRASSPVIPLTSSF